MIFDKLFNTKWNPDKHVLITIPYENVSTGELNAYMIYLQSKLYGWFSYDEVCINGIHRFRILSHDITPMQKIYFDDRCPMMVVDEILNMEPIPCDTVVLNDGFVLFTHKSTGKINKEKMMFAAKQIQKEFDVDKYQKD